MFYVGQEVICVQKTERGPPRYPIVGQKYTIRGIFTDIQRPNLGVGLLLEEIINPPHPRTLREWNFYSSRFRPIQKKKTDISIFTALLNPANHKQLENT